ncbi:MAG TPA: hypothetical protein VFT98_17435, partial [Myxococcota bacterium]|nr:hypothetical protein [Myxococcota bacterium]
MASTALREIALGMGLLALAGCGSSGAHGTRSGSPTDALPPNVTRLVTEGLRPDWSADGSRLLYLDALVGNVFELELATRAVRPLTGHFAHSG